MSRASNGRRGARGDRHGAEPAGHEDAQAAGHRHARLQQILHEELSSLLRDEVSDPALLDVAVTSVDLSVDYRNARVLFVFEESPMSGRDAASPTSGRDAASPTSDPAAPREGITPARILHEKEQAALRALGRAAPFLRARLVDAVDIKQVPQLRFVFDAAAAEERAVLAVLRGEDQDNP